MVFKNQFPDNLKPSEVQDFMSSDEINMMDFIKRCLSIDPNRRLTCDEAMRHDWFKDLLIYREKEIEQNILELQDRQYKLILKDHD